MKKFLGDEISEMSAATQLEVAQWLPKVDNKCQFVQR